MNRAKYTREETCPSKMNGSSTGWLPIQVRITKVVVRSQKNVCEAGRNVLAWFLELWRRGTRNKIRIEARRAITPPSFLGIDRSIAYANKKYHSGCMWTGVTSGFAGLNFSGSFRRLGDSRTMAASKISSTINPVISLVEK